MPKSVPNAHRVTCRISSTSTGALSPTWWHRFQANTRYQPSPKGAMKAKPSPTALTVNTSGGGVLSRTSANMIDLITDRPGKGSPSALRTTLRTPSAPTTYAARYGICWPPVVRAVTSTPCSS